MAKDDDFGFPDNPKILFDLRQTYAMQILTPILIALEIARSNNDFQKWYDTLAYSLYVNIYQKLEEDEREEYKKVKEACLQTLHSKKLAYQGTPGQSIEDVHIVKSALMDLEMWMKSKMEDHGLFGKGSEYDIDEI